MDYVALVIDNRTIEKIYPVGTVQEADRVIEIAGNTLLPGFMDLHTHLYFKHEDIPLLASQSNTRATIDGVSFAQDKLR